MPGPDAISPTPPKAVYFDPKQNAWVVSRYLDVLAGLRQPELLMVSPKGDHPPPIHDEAEHLKMRAAAQDALSTEAVDQWQKALEARARGMVGELPLNRPIDLIKEFAFPWCLAGAVTVTGVDPAQAEHLAELADPISAAAAAPEDNDLARQAAAAVAELKRHFPAGNTPLGASTFVALSQTMPRLLANAWLALFRNPSELAKLRSKPDLMPRAVEELLRHAGTARVLHRRAAADMHFRGVFITEGEPVVLMLYAANHDPQQFPQPDRLDVTRRPAGQLALGAGPYACLGAGLIRMIVATGTSAWLTKFGAAKRSGSVDWLGGSGFRWPAALILRN